MLSKEAMPQEHGGMQSVEEDEYPHKNVETTRFKGSPPLVEKGQEFSSSSLPLFLLDWVLSYGGSFKFQSRGGS